jgi:dienelactone hydrolase
MRRKNSPLVAWAFCMTLVFIGAACIAPAIRAQEVPAPRVVDLTAPDDVTLKATYFAAGKDGPGVLLLHQCNMQRKSWDGLAPLLAAAGMNVLTLDFRGFGESGGVAMFKLPPEEDTKMLAEVWPGDVDTALKYLEAQPGVNSEFIGAAGASCGVNQAVQLAKRHSEVKSLVLLSEGTDPFGRHYLRNSMVPVLGVAADDDSDWGVVDFLKWIVNLSPNPDSKFVDYKTGGHGVVMFESHKELPGMIVDWFAATLKPSPAPKGFRTGMNESADLIFMDELEEPGGVSRAAKMLADAKKKDPKEVLFSEAVINRLGYEQLILGDTKSAIEILKLNVSAFPNSPNAYDSLADVYLAAGEKDLARQSAKKALELIATDTADSAERKDGIKQNAEDKLKKLSGEQK